MTAQLVPVLVLVPVPVPVPVLLLHLGSRRCRHHRHCSLKATPQPT